MLLVDKLKHLVASERKITAEIIELIQEIDCKKIYLQMGFANLYVFLTEYIGYTAASAQRRIEAARLLTFVTEVKEDLKSGALNLSQVSMVAQSIRQKQKEAPTLKFNREDKKSLLESVKGLNLESSQKVLCQTLDLEVKEFEKQKLQANESVRLELTLTKEQNDMLKKVKSLISHVNPNATTAEVIELLANDYLKRKDPARKKQTVLNSREQRASSITAANFRAQTKTNSVAEVKACQSSFNQKRVVNKNRKAISASIKRAVWQRDQGKCQHKNKTTGKTCGSKHLLEFDHIKRYSHGGDESFHNLRLYCKAHNLWRG
jgi:5-methylcytosine-specific restriction endonuclease McrA